MKYVRYYKNNRHLYTVDHWWWFKGSDGFTYKNGRFETIVREPGWRCCKRHYGPTISCIDRDWYYTFHTGRYAWFRCISTYQERRENDFFDKYDEDRKIYKIKMRRARSKNLVTSWDDIPTGRIGGKSWKDYTKYRKQWMINEQD